MSLSSVPQVILWLFVIVAGIMSGGSIYERLVVWPLWALSPPESVKQWKGGAIQGAFFAPATPLYGIFSIALAVASQWMPQPQAAWALVAGVSGLITVVWTFMFFLQILRKTQFSAGAGLADAEITRLVRRFELWQWARWVLLIGGWIAGLRALNLAQ